MGNAEKISNRPGLQVLLAHQARMQQVATKIGVLDAAVTTEREKIAAALEGLPSVDELNTKRQELAAAVSLGQITDDERSFREAELSNFLERMRQADKVAAEAEDAISGIDKLRAVLAAELADLNGMKTELLDQALQSEANRVCEAYVEAAFALKDRLMQLLALNEVVRRNGGKNFREIDWHKFFVPSFRLPACADLAHPNAMSTLFSTANIKYDDGHEKAFRSEMERLRDLGITLL